MPTLAETSSPSRSRTPASARATPRRRPCLAAKRGLVLALILTAALVASADAADVIDLSTSILSINGSLTTETAAAVSVAAPVGPFIGDFDGDGIPEVDTNGNGLDRWDPELRDYSGPPDGTLELPPDSIFTSHEQVFEFASFDVPANVFIEVTGPLRVNVDGNVVLDGVLRAPADVEIAATGTIRSAGVMRVAAGLMLRTAMAGTVAQGLVAGGCSASASDKIPFPTFSAFGLVVLILAIVTTATLALRSRGAVALARTGEREDPR